MDIQTQIIDIWGLLNTPFRPGTRDRETNGTTYRAILQKLNMLKTTFIDQNGDDTAKTVQYIITIMEQIGDNPELEASDRMNNIRKQAKRQVEHYFKAVVDFRENEAVPKVIDAGRRMRYRSRKMKKHKKSKSHKKIKRTKRRRY